MLIFDSGVGGLSILESIQIMLPKIHYIYVLDNEAFPYGNKTEYFIVQRTIKIIQIIKKKYPIKIVVIACNTASTVALSYLKKIFNLPIIGIFPAIKTAEKITKNKIIGLIATKRTINSHYIQKLIHKKSSSNTIKIISTNQLAIIAEKKIRGSVFSKQKIKNIFMPWIHLDTQPDTIILGCTHFLFLEPEIQEIFHVKSLINFIDSREEIIYHIKSYFHESKFDQKIKQNIFLYSKYNDFLKNLLFFLKKYQFQEIKHINLY